MSYNTNTSGHSGSSYDALWSAKTPGFNPYKLIAVLVGFLIFPPLGIAALLYFLWRGRQHGWMGFGPGRWAQGERGEQWARGGCGRGRMRNMTGNTAFDEHRAKVLNELEEERRAFHQYRAEERRKRDQEAFDAFNSSKSSRSGESGDAGEQK